jgi:protoheme IX farnesyltransferase
MRSISNILVLIKYKIAFSITFTTFAGFVLFERGFNMSLIWALLGVFFLSSGAMALNQLQEMKQDALMKRTSRRPLATGSMTPLQAFVWVIIFLVAGSIILAVFFSPATVILGLFNVVWYNLIYTPLKRITPFAVVPGAIIGAIPAVLGWAAAGGSLLDIQIWVLAFFLFLWQIPHFWLILFYYNDDYETGGFPGIERVFSKENINFIIFAWVLATSFSSLLFPMFNLITQPLLIIGLVAANLVLIYIFVQLLSAKKVNSKIISFIGINVYMIVVLLFSMLNLLFV